MKSEFKFTFTNIESQYRSALAMGYRFISCLQYAEQSAEIDGLTIVNRVDIDLSVAKADKIRDIFDRLGIKATFFVRLHAPEYNPFSFENYRILKRIRNSGHEIGYHSEIVDQASIWSEDAAVCLVRDIDVLNRMLNISVKGIASHGGMTGLNNLDFWKKNQPKYFGALYEAYEESSAFNLFKSSFYISDSEFIRWKCYNKGELCLNDRRSFEEHLVDRHRLIYLLIHPELYYDEFPYS